MVQSVTKGSDLLPNQLSLALPAWLDPVVLWQSLLSTTNEIELLWAATILLLMGGLLAWLAPTERNQIRAAVVMFGFGLVAAFLSAWLLAGGRSTSSAVLRSVAFLLERAALINLAGIFIFDVLLRRLHLEVPRILRDVLLALAYITLLLTHLGRAGVNVSGIVATSAVITAVLAFSLQDTLGNILGGLALQIEKSIHVGDWIQVDRHVGRVVEIRWRQTTIETRKWDSVIIPNSHLIKSQVTIIGRRQGQPVQQRQELYFHVDARYTPHQVIAAVEGALRESPIPGAATVPPPDCVVDDFKESYIQYCARYWLVNLSSDMPTSGEVRMRIFYGLRRARIPVSIPAQRLFLTWESDRREARRTETELTRRIKTLGEITLFASLTAAEQQEVAEQLQPVAFMRGEEITKQGAEGHDLYIVTAGQAEVRISSGNGLSKTVAVLQAGDILGEMSLMTGEPRSATVIALEELQAYRLDHASFTAILTQRPELAEELSHILAQRRVELDSVREGLDAESRQRRFNVTQTDILARMRRFFSLSRQA